VGWEDGVGGFVVEVVGHVGEEGAAGLDALDQGDGVVQRGVGGVGLTAESVEDENVEVGEQREALGGDVVEIGEVGCGAEAVAGDGLAAVGDGDTLEAGAEQGYFCAWRGREPVQGDAGAGGVAIVLTEGVVEDALDGGCGGVVGVEGEGFRVMEAEGAEVVHAEDVVGVAVGVEDGVESVDASADSLGVEVGAGIDDDVVVFVGDEDGGASTAVVRVAGGGDGGGADGAVAAERWDAH